MNKLKLILCITLLAPSARAQQALTGGLEKCDGLASMKAIRTIDGLIVKGNEYAGKADEQISNVQARCGTGTYEERCRAAKATTTSYRLNAEAIERVFRLQRVAEALSAKGADDAACLAEINDAIEVGRQNVDYLKNAYNGVCVEATRNVGCL